MWWCSPASGQANGSNPPLSRAERKHGLSTEQLPVPAFVESSKNLQGLKGLVEVGARRRVGLVVGEAEHPRLFLAELLKRHHLHPAAHFRSNKF